MQSKLKALFFSLLVLAFCKPRGMMWRQEATTLSETEGRRLQLLIQAHNVSYIRQINDASLRLPAGSCSLTDFVRALSRILLVLSRAPSRISLVLSRAPSRISLVLSRRFRLCSLKQFACGLSRISLVLSRAFPWTSVVLSRVLSPISFVLSLSLISLALFRGLRLCSLTDFAYALSLGFHVEGKGLLKCATRYCGGVQICTVVSEAHPRLPVRKT